MGIKVVSWEKEKKNMSRLKGWTALKISVHVGHRNPHADNRAKAQAAQALLDHR